jgi:DNA-binding NarL/FixJ family response regulator
MPTLPKSSCTLLIVDDHPLYRQGMRSALTTLLPEASVLEADSAEDGARLLKAHPAVDLVLIDLHLQGMDGFVALAWYAQHFPLVARVIISGQDDAASVARAMQAGAAGFISKTWAVGEMVSAIRRVLAGELVTPAIAQHSPPPLVANLTLRELEVLRLLGLGHANLFIAQTLGVTERTVKAHLAAIYQALHADNRTQAVLIAQRAGYLPSTPITPAAPDVQR